MRALDGPTRSGPALERLRTALLAVVGVTLAHDAVFAAQYGLGPARDAALAATAHAYWPALTALAVLAVVVGTGLTLMVAVRVGRHVAGLPAPAVGQTHGYGRAVLRLWPRLFAVVLAAFLVQENIEHLVAGEAAPGLYALSAPGYPLAIPVIALVTGLLAAVGGWIRQHHDALLLRLRAARRAWLRSLARATRELRAWRLVGALVALGRILARGDAGRAPPVSARA